MQSHTDSARPRFSLGRTIVTPDARKALSEFEVLFALSRHQCGDWGELEEQDLAVNERAVLTGGRLVSVFSSPSHVRHYVITESDRSVTTVLMPYEY